MTHDFTVNDSKPFIEWLKKFKEFTSSSILLEMTHNGFKTKTYTEDKSCVKGSFISYNDINFFPSKELEHNVFVGIFDIKKLTDVLKYFDDNEFKVKFTYNELKTEDETKLVCEYFNIINNEINFKVNCPSLTGFYYIDDNKFDAICQAPEVVESEIDGVTISKLKQLVNLDKCDAIKIQVAKNNIFFSGDNFKYNASKLTSPNPNEFNISIRKDYFMNIDNNNCSIEVSDRKVVFISDDKNTKTIIAKMNVDA